MLRSRDVTTPLGPMTAIVNDRGLLLCEFADRPMLPEQLSRVLKLFGEFPVPGGHVYLDQTQRELDEYFAGDRDEFTIPLVLDGTPFQNSVWQQLLTIPFGKTTSYDQIAKRVDCPGGARAVGRANGDNRIAIIVPCHRVIGADGSLTGYGGGQRRKRWLLNHEQRGLQMSFAALDV
jgi:AraC family transcriptional regulator of adaptative response/methylated-DNA-[protein]-cysteine methyltransferase